MLINLFKLLRSIGAKLEVIWVPRTFEQLVIADLGSKFQDTDDWGICQKSFMTLQHIASASVTCDCFASSTNRRCEKYYSKFASPHCSGINAFSQVWADDFNFCCPPVKEIAFVIQHLLSTPAQGILVVPMWPGSIYWPRLTVDGRHFLPMFYRFHVFRTNFIKGRFCDKNIFNPQSKNIDMIGLVFNSSRDHKMPITAASCLTGGCHLCQKL